MLIGKIKSEMKPKYQSESILVRRAGIHSSRIDNIKQRP